MSIAQSVTATRASPSEKATRGRRCKNSDRSERNNSDATTTISLNGIVMNSNTSCPVSCSVIQNPIASTEALRPKITVFGNRLDMTGGCYHFVKLSKTLFPAIVIEIVTEAEIQQSQPASTESTPYPKTATDPFSKKPLTLTTALLWSATSVTAFHLAYSVPYLPVLTIVYVFALLQLMRARTNRQSFYLSLVVGIFIAAPQMSCFWVLFGPSSIALWLILAFWTALFVTLGRLWLNNLGAVRGGLLLPLLWTGLEYF